jgi:hypothetical protein
MQKFLFAQTQSADNCKLRTEQWLILMIKNANLEKCLFTYHIISLKVHNTDLCTYVLSGFRREAHENCPLLDYYATLLLIVSSGLLTHFCYNNYTPHLIPCRGLRLEGYL